ncbi:Crp/Fnr family transcriptional regulator [Stenotrophomonas indicatrix]|uniref:Crp/Fnr family transcriptional regulator n=1 Tax=Stenotrophomonas indicatrix TaxID=2045451 RepID=UPI00215A2E22|nr:helix-turn-helix domain-containing protein [Stenotrophomonas indicatrix]MCR8713293.1 helix-turn-helix domain-containing protein [Stenotrophomonas indicatrix]
MLVDQLLPDSSMQVVVPAPGQDPPGTAPQSIMALLQNLPVQRRRLQPRGFLFRAGQPCHALFMVHAGLFKTCVLSEDGRERVTGFHLRGELLGIDSFDMPTYACDAIALDTCDVWELPLSWLKGEGRDLMPCITGMLAAEIRRDWRWMLAVGTLSAERRVVTFLLDLAARLQLLGYSAHHMQLRMTRADLGSFLALQLETVTRALSHLDATGVIVVNRREIRIRDEARLRSMLACS